ncbi:hypothetical protein H2O64_13985 [Kordia sp. YSTF-M3]|uniref:DKNYY family protein n=1 Tax=Kordia aestuariivivens TaxID=2759037 RepID=A0ABR7QB70_9FLAO|nr:hypothetical protein [Kordia aestuariivivens]MBC8755782.1 hypothetical protein [Kordia aestuariivivens]
MKSYLLLACLVLFCISCSTDDNTIPEPEQNFHALTVGNFWVYDHYRRTAPNSDVFENINVIDSVKIVGTEEIDGNTFFKFRTRTSGNEANQAFCSPNGEHFQYYRDSLGYLVNEFGKVKFSRNDNQEFLLRGSGSFYLYTALAASNEMVSTTVGDFDCQWMEVYARQDPSVDPYPGLDRYYFSEEIGLIFNTSSFSSNPLHTVERRLIAYDVQ